MDPATFLASMFFLGALFSLQEQHIYIYIYIYIYIKSLYYHLINIVNIEILSFIFFSPKLGVPLLKQKTYSGSNSK